MGSQRVLCKTIYITHASTCVVTMMNSVIADYVQVKTSMQPNFGQFQCLWLQNTSLQAKTENTQNELILNQ